MRRLRQLLGRGAVLVLHDIPRDFIFPIVFVLAVLTVVAAGSLGLLVRTSKNMYRKNGGGVHLIPHVLGWGRSSSIELDVGDSFQEGILICRKGLA